ncbi:50S ribosomal protein L24 [Candidatus Manganitrophus noduliformans]|uniref:50S ribosomal protein L24 n=1 Tax=Candidatus Manganitrophus noduliformans TaxID=2606439 RepID=UPI003BEF1990
MMGKAALPLLRTKIKKGDIVHVVAGKEKGKEGKVLQVLPDKQAVVVEKLNLLKKHTRPNQKNPKGGIVEREGRVHLSNVMIVCANCVKPRRIGSKTLPDGKKLRVCKSCGEALDKEG